MDEFDNFPGPGKTSPRLLKDLFDSDASRPRHDGWNILADPAPKWRATKTYPLRVLPRDCHHVLMKKREQSYQPSAIDSTQFPAKYISASFCSRCMQHFDLTVDFGQQPSKTSPCNGRSEPLHHLVRREVSENEDGEQTGRSNPKIKVLQRLRYSCSAPNCPMVVDIQISAPRLSNENIKLLTDPAIVYNRGQKAIAYEPERYQNIQPLPPHEVLSVLRQYLKDSFTQDPAQTKRIAVRNKKFLLAFADDCDDVLRYLGFQRFEEAASATEEPSVFWKLPMVPLKSQDPFLRNGRTLLLDVLDEISQRIVDRPIDDKITTSLRAQWTPLPAKRDLEQCLGCYEYPRHSRTIDLSEEEHPHYAGLGAVGDFSDELLIFAYERQCECDPKNRPYYLDCLKGIATGRKSGGLSSDNADLQEKVAMLVSMGELSLSEIEDAYKFLSIDPNTKEGDDYIIGTYKSRVESAPRQKDEAKKCLSVIGQSRGSAKIKEVAANDSMTSAEAMDFLGVSAETASDTIEAYAIALASEGDRTKVAKALRAIATERGNDYTLQSAATKLDSGNLESTLSVAEAYRRLQISDTSVPDDTVFTYYHSLSGEAPAGSKDSYTEALRVIAERRKSSFLLAKLNDPNAEAVPEVSNAEQPVGLNNIGNTCYLNSLLQYYYTIKAVREVVMNFDEYRMALDAASTGKKRVGGRAVDKAEIIKSQRFVEELGSLYRNLKTTTSRSVRPTQDLAELTLFSSATEANYRRASISSPSGVPQVGSVGPLFGPEGPPPLTVTNSSDFVDEPKDIQMVDMNNSKLNDSDDASSEATLVNDPPSLEELAKIESKKQEAAASTSGVKSSQPKSTLEKDDLDTQGDVIMNDDIPVASESQTTQASPDKPPPVPPRHKPAAINTKADSVDAVREKKLQFGAQQDVTEVIGNVMFRLHCAIKPTSIDPKFGEQIDSIRDTFYGSNAVYLKKAATVDAKIEDWMSIIVYPGPTGSRDIYEALDIVYDEQIVEIDNTLTPQYTAIRKLPPVLQIQIQRTEFDAVRQQASKNQNQLVFEETIYLDRYMDEPPESLLMQRRKQSWKWKDRLRKLDARRSALQASPMTNASAASTKNTTNSTTTTASSKILPASSSSASSSAAAGLAVPDALRATASFLQQLQHEEEKEKESTDDDEHSFFSTSAAAATAPLLAIPAGLPALLGATAASLGAELAAIEAESAELRARLAGLFADLRRCRYSLQAVFIHRGTSSYGHYWIYIYDFGGGEGGAAGGVWREYNDERVEEVKGAEGRRRIFDQAFAAGATPYYLVYVRDEDKEGLVDAVCREIEAADTAAATTQTMRQRRQGESEDTAVDAVVGVDEDDIFGDAVHVEDVAKPGEGWQQGKRHTTTTTESRGDTQMAGLADRVNW